MKDSRYDLFDRDFAEFDRNFKRMTKLVGTGVILSWLIILAMLGGIVWLVIVILGHFGII